MTVGIDLPWTKMIAPELLEIGEGTLALKQTPEELHLNHNGDMHAGVLFSMSEMAGMGVVVLFLGELAADSLIVVKNVNIDFIARAQGAIIFTGIMPKAQQARTLEKAKAGEKVEELILVEAKDAEGTLVSKSTVTAVISPKRGE